MKILLCAINAKYIHSNYAIRCLKSYLECHSTYTATIAEYTINHDLSLILQQLYIERPDVIGFSCYIWNIEYVKELSVELKKLLPETRIVWGGPEVSYESEQYLNGYADYLISGEGEIPFTQLVSRLGSGQPADRLQFGETTPLEAIPFVYPDMSELSHRILYYETSRGCPFSCQYCLSSIDKHLHFLPLDRVFSDLDRFLTRRVKQVKLIDRTFNCDKKRAEAIWQYLIEHDNQVTNFHFEIAGQLLDPHSLDLLATARPGLFQFEIGVQSVNPDTLRAIQRSTDTDTLFERVAQLRERGNIHIHLDLIAGLPYEGLDSFAESFNAVYAQKPHQLQLGFLKVLKGSAMAKQKAAYHLLCREKPPYEVMATNWLSPDDLLRLKRIENMVERYYNSNRYRALIGYLEGFFETPFAFYDRLGEFYEHCGFHLITVSEVDSYTVLYRFLETLDGGDKERFGWLARYDLFSHAKAKRLPDWLDQNGVTPHLDQIRAFYQAEENRRYYPEYAAETDPRQLMRLLHLELFPFDPRDGQDGCTLLLFNYRNCDLFGNATVTKPEFPL